MSSSLYARALEVLAEAGEPFTTREIFDRLSLHGVIPHHVSKALNNLKTMGRVSSAKTPELGQRSQWWFLESSAPRSLSGQTAQEACFRYTATGALAIVANGRALLVPARVVPALRAFLRASPTGRPARKIGSGTTVARRSVGRRGLGKARCGPI